MVPGAVVVFFVSLMFEPSRSSLSVVTCVPRVSTLEQALSDGCSPMDKMSKQGVPDPEGGGRAFQVSCFIEHPVLQPDVSKNLGGPSHL